MFKRIKKALVGLASLSLGLGAFSGVTSVSAEEEVKFGFIVSQTGPAAAYGESIKNGVDLAVEEINENSEKEFVIITEDDKSDKNEAINAMNKLVYQDNVLAVQGPTLSGSMFAAGPIAQEAGVVALGTSTTADGITDIGDYVFRNAVPEALAVAEAVRQAHAKNDYKTAAIMYSNNNDQMVSVNGTLEDTFKELGIEVVETVTFADGDTDFSAQVTKVKEANPDLIAVASLYQEGVLVVKNLRSEGLEQDIIGSNGFNSPAFLEGAEDAANGSIVGTPWFPERDADNVRQFREAYEAKFGIEPDQFAAQSYDATYLMYQAWQDSDYTTDRAAFKDALAAISDFEGVTGKFKFDENGDPDMEVQVLQIRDGKFQPLND